MNIVERIKVKCKENNTNIKTLEEELGFGNGSIRRWENQKPSYDKIILVANKLNVTINWLIFGKESEELSPEEQKLIDFYRNADTQSKITIMQVAELAANNSKQEAPKSSTSKIG